MNIENPRKIAITVALAILIVGSVLAGFLLSRPERASATDEAIKAAEAIRQEHGGGKQPTNDQGVPLDAVVDPNNKPGRIEPKGPGG